MDEQCILTDLSGKCTGQASKKDCHLNANIQKGMLHRAFSVFAFRREQDGTCSLLLQQRSTAKITFPAFYSNTCCSHPLASIPEENVLEDALGVRLAAVRKLRHELGVTNALPDDFVWCGVIRHSCESDATWGEHEIDYILLLEKELDIEPNENEVMAHAYLSRSAFRTLIQSGKLADGSSVQLTPWLKHLHNSRLLDGWWDAVNDESFRIDGAKYAAVRNELVDFVTQSTF